MICPGQDNASANWAAQRCWAQWNCSGWSVAKAERTTTASTRSAVKSSVTPSTHDHSWSSDQQIPHYKAGMLKKDHTFFHRGHWAQLESRRMQNPFWIIISIFCSALDFPWRAQSVHWLVYPVKSGEINVQAERRKVGNTKIRRAVFQLKIARKRYLRCKRVHHKNQSKILWSFYWNILSSKCPVSKDAYDKAEIALQAYAKKTCCKYFVWQTGLAKRVCSSVSACLAILFCPSCQMENK